MRVPISWLKDYVDLTLPIDQLAERLTFAGLEVETIDYIGLPGAALPWDPEKIVTGQVVSVEKHPNADKLLLVDVNIGRAEPIRLVTGAPNLKAGDSGQKVVVALNGARLYDGHKEGRAVTTLKPAVLRGIKNDSMVCSEKELGISDEHEGIIILPPDAPVGVPFVDYAGDAVLEIAILPNTARCASIIGVAREVAALTNQHVRYPVIDYAESAESTASQVTIQISDPALNPRFTAGIIKGVTQRPSPVWMQQRLTLVGMRPINNIVDTSNYVMMEWGHPTHAFDLAALKRLQGGEHVTVLTRTARPGEQLVTLDGKSHELESQDILVCDPQRALSVAGVMGGSESEVTGATTDILHEVAGWQQTSIRRTARTHNFHSEASYRFARGVHPDLAPIANRRFLQLLQQNGGGQISTGLVDVYPNPRQTTTIDLFPTYVERLLGVQVSLGDMTNALERLEFAVEPVGGLLRVTPPNHRLDIEGPHDLVEEIGRIYGMENIPVRIFDEPMPAAVGNPELEFEERVKDVLVEAGLTEIVSYRMTTPEQEHRTMTPGTPVDDRPMVRIQNPINPERSGMRRTLLAGVLESLQSNIRHHERVAIFELGSVYIVGEQEAGHVSEPGDDVLPNELPRVTLAMTGASSAQSWRTAKSAPMDFYELKGVVEALLNGIHGTAPAGFVPIAHPSLYPGRAAAVEVSGQRIGIFGELHPQVRAEWNLPDQPVLIADLDIRALRAISQDLAQARDVMRFPLITEDLAVVVDEAISGAQVEQTIKRAGGNLLRSITLFDVFRGEQVGAGKKSMAYSLSYQSSERVLTMADIEKPRTKIIKSLEGQLGGAIRAS